MTLTARVYNYSLVDTPPNATIHVRFYGQLYCSSGSGTTEASCINWNTSAACGASDLCGNSFLIGEQTIPQIAGFESSDGNGAPNWKLASQDFLPANFPAIKNGNDNMVFWVATWMEDGSGKLVGEMPDHGLKTIPVTGLTQITQVDVQKYSNNVGMYPVHLIFSYPAGRRAGAGGNTDKWISAGHNRLDEPTNSTGPADQSSGHAAGGRRASAVRQPRLFRRRPS